MAAGKGKGRKKVSAEPKGPRELSDRERLFVGHYCRRKDAGEAYKLAGYKWKTDAEALAKGTNLMCPHVNPHVAAAVATEIGKLNGDPVLDARGVLRYIHRVMTLTPLALGFDPGDDGTWTISMDAMKRLPAEVLQLVEDVEYRQVDLGDGRLATRVSVAFVGKGQAMALAAKYQLTGLVFGQDGLPASDAGGTGAAEKGVDWDRLMGARQVGSGGGAGQQPSAGVDHVEKKILALEARAADKNGHVNGDGKGTG